MGLTKPLGKGLFLVEKLGELNEPENGHTDEKSAHDYNEANQGDVLLTECES